MTLQVLLTGLGAIITAAAGIVLLVREFRRRDRIAAARQIDDMAGELTITRQDLLAYEQWAFITSGLLISNGIVAPKLPEVHRAATDDAGQLEKRWQWRKDHRKERRDRKKSEE